MCMSQEGYNVSGDNDPRYQCLGKLRLLCVGQRNANLELVAKREKLVNLGDNTVLFGHWRQGYRQLREVRCLDPDRRHSSPHLRNLRLNGR